MKQKKSTGILLRLLMICLGAALASSGIDLAIPAGFGSATLAVLWQGVSVRFGLSYGVASLLVAGAMVAFCLVYDRSQIHVGTILYQIVYTFAIDFFRTRVYYTESVVLNFGIMLLGIAVFAVGTAFYAFADLGRGSYEALTFAFVKKKGWQTKTVRITLDILVVVVGVLLGGKAGICTLCTIFLSGHIIQWTMGRLRKWTGLQTMAAMGK